MRRKYSPLPLMRHKYPAKPPVQRARERTPAARCRFGMRGSGVGVDRGGRRRAEEGGAGRRKAGEGGEPLIEFPQRGGTTRWLRWVARPPCKERGGDRRDATSSQAVATWVLLPLGTAGSHGEVRGQWATVDVAYSAAASSERAVQALSLSLFLSLSFSLSVPLSLSLSHVSVCVCLCMRAAYGSMLPLIPP